MLRFLMVTASVVPALGLIQSLPAWKTKYTAEVATKTTSFDVKFLNQKVEGVDAPSGVGAADLRVQALWSWYNTVPAGIEKTAAKVLMDKSFSDLGGDGSINTDFLAKVAAEYAKAANAKVKDAYEDVYKTTTAATLDPANALNVQYHSMNAEQKKSAASSLENPLRVKWNTAFQEATFKATWDAATTYLGFSEIIANIMSTGVNPADVASGQDLFDGYKAAKDNKDDLTLGVFDRLMAAALASHLQ